MKEATRKPQTPQRKCYISISNIKDHTKEKKFNLTGEER